MESSSDSSIWRSLAVAFGDGLAFGVGMKLSQNAARKSERPAANVFDPLANRMEQVEQRLQRMERAPALLAAASSATASAPRAGNGAGAFDQKVLDAVVNALEARLKEHSGQVERYLTDLEAKIAIELQSLHQQDQSTASGAQTRLDEVRQVFDQRISAAHERLERDIGSLRAEVVSLNREFAEAVAHIVEQQVAASVKTQADALGQTLDRNVAAAAQAVEERVSSAVEAQTGAAEHRVTSAMEARVGALEQQLSATVEARLGGIEQQVSAAIGNHLELLDRHVAETIKARASATEAAVAAALRGEFDALEKDLRERLERKDREIAELRERLADGDRAALDFVAAVGDLCRRTSDRIAKPGAPPANAAGPQTLSIPAEPEPPAEPERPAAFAPPPAPEPELEPAPPPAPQGLHLAPHGPPSSMVAAAASPEPEPQIANFDSLPAFAQPKAGRPWRFPVVSSFLALTMGLMLLRYW